MEACTGAHHWAREFQALGHTVRQMAPKFVAPYRISGKRGKNDAADAAAICEAVQPPNLRFVPPKSVEQQGRLMVHRARQEFVAEVRQPLMGLQLGQHPCEFGHNVGRSAKSSSSIVKRRAAYLGKLTLMRSQAPRV